MTYITFIDRNTSLCAQYACLGHILIDKLHKIRHALTALNALTDVHFQPIIALCNYQLKIDALCHIVAIYFIREEMRNGTSSLAHFFTHSLEMHLALGD